MRNKHIVRHKEILKNALSLLKYEDFYKEFFFHGNILNLPTGFRFNSCPKRLKKYKFIFNHITNNLWNICYLVQRLEFTRTASLSNNNLEKLWHAYAGLDIEHLYIEFISLCNYFASLIWGCFDEIPNNKSDSFYKLLIWIYKNPEKTDPDLLDIIKKADLYKRKDNLYKSWFGHMREIRDNINHRGAKASIFGSPKDGFLFQIFSESLKKSIPALPHIKFNDNVVFFDKYFSLQISNLFMFSEELAGIIMSKYKITHKGARSSGFDTLYLWINNFYDNLSKADS